MARSGWQAGLGVAAAMALALIEPVTVAVHCQDMDVMGKPPGTQLVHLSNGRSEARSWWSRLERMARRTPGAIVANASRKSGGLC